MKTGKLPGNIVKLSMLNQLHTKNKQVISGAAVGADCAFLEIPQNQFCVVCSAEGELNTKEMSGEDNGTGFTIAQLIQICFNRLAAGGARPVAAFFSLFLPEETENIWIRSLMAEAENVCSLYSVQTAGVHGCVLKEIRKPAAVVNGYGSAAADRKRTLKNSAPFQDIVLSKWVGLLGTVILAERYKEQICGHYPAFLMENVEHFHECCSVLKEAEIALTCKVSAMYAASEGGIFAALWELSEGAGVGFEVDLKKVPLRQETVEICEFLGANPYELHSEGCLVMTADDGEELVKALRAEGIEAVTIGRTTDQKGKIIQNDDEVRYMDRPKQDEIFRNCL